MFYKTAGYLLLLSAVVVGQVHYLYRRKIGSALAAAALAMALQIILVLAAFLFLHLVDGRPEVTGYGMLLAIPMGIVIFWWLLWRRANS